MRPEQKLELKERIRLYEEERRSSPAAAAEDRDQAGKQRAFPYGTAGFRGPADQMDHIFYRAGLMASLRCLSVRGRNIGVMITASHNPVRDNGIKFIDDTGLMLDSRWEPLVETLCNSTHLDSLVDRFEELVSKFEIELDSSSASVGQVFIAHDTRPSSVRLAALVMRGIAAVFQLVKCTNLGLMTTPGLHYLVAESNKRAALAIVPLAYNQKLARGVADHFKAPPKSTNRAYESDLLVVDCANGVGKEVVQYLQSDAIHVRPYLRIETINTSDSRLNEECGADFVKTQHRAPAGANRMRKRYASLDGDADRVVFFYLTQSSTNSDDIIGGQPITGSSLRLLDGDKILVLFALYMRDILEKSEHASRLSIGCVQTAYANGASTDYLARLGFQVDCVETGVKNLHSRALSCYDVGIYFEANGHGTITLSPTAEECFDRPGNENGVFRNLRQLLNQYAGDGVCDLLLVEVILRHFDWTTEDWDALYADRPNRLIQLAVGDKSLIKTVDAGRKCSAPAGLQAEIDAIVAGHPGARCFVRPSGTENVVRVYAEAEHQSRADEIAHLVGEKTVEYCNRMQPFAE